MKIEPVFECDPKKNTTCTRQSCSMGGGECRSTHVPEFSTDRRIQWPAFYVKGLSTPVGCECCPLGPSACELFRRRTPTGEYPCDVFDTYTDYLIAKETTREQHT